MSIAVPDYGMLDLVWLVVCATMVLLMQAGFCLLESGLVRTKNSVNVAFKNLADFALCGVLYLLIGFGVMYGRTLGGVVGWGGYGLGSADGEPWILAFFLFQLMFCGTATTIVSGAVAERMRLYGYLIITILIAVLLYPVFGHWAWAGQGASAGWLKKLGFVDFAGAAVVHQLGGWIALACVLVIGPRLGKFRRRGIEIEGHNMTLATLGLLLLWFGWYGFNGGSALMFSPQVPLIIVNTGLAGAGAGASILALLLFSRRKPPLKNLISACIAGLVSVTAGCHVLDPMAALFCGAVAGLLCHGVTRFLELRGVDDVVDAFATHAVGGIWGTLSLPFLSSPDALGTGLGRWQQFGVQAVGVGACSLWAFGFGGLLILGLDRWLPLRVSHEEERLGLNLAEHGIKSDLLSVLSELDRLEERGNLPSELDVDPFSHDGQVVLKYTGVLRRAGSEARKVARSARRLEESEASLHRKTHYDELTGLASRELFEARLVKALERVHHPEGVHFAVVLIDVDRFSVVVDSLGREASDELLRSLGDRIVVALGDGSVPEGEQIVCRLAGDEFAILLGGVAEREVGEQLATHVERSIASRTHVVAGNEIVVSVSIGVVVCGREYRQSARVMRDATLAMRHAKRSRVRSVVLFDPFMRREAERRLQLEIDLRQAIANDQLQLLYQPIVSPKGLGFEALLRWDHPTEGVLPPREFLPAAEEIGLIDDVGGWALEAAVEQLAAWRTKNRDRELAITVNVSRPQLMGAEFKQQLDRVLASRVVPAETITLDVTERAAKSGQEFYQRIAELHESGVRVVLDHFGGGHVSLDRLPELEIDGIKLDSSLIAPIGASASHTWILRTIVSAAHDRGLRVTGSGVENVSQYERLVRVGCDRAQGFLFSPPLSAQEAEEWLDLHATGFFSTIQRLGTYDSE